MRRNCLRPWHRGSSTYERCRSCGARLSEVAAELTMPQKVKHGKKRQRKECAASEDPFYISAEQLRKDLESGVARIFSKNDSMGIGELPSLPSTTVVTP